MPIQKGKNYILLVVDFVTRYPEAVALTNIEADSVTQVRFTIFSRVGFLKGILSDRESYFMSQLFSELWKLCGVKQRKASPYHPEANGLVKRFSGTLQSVLGM